MREELLKGKNFAESKYIPSGKEPYLIFESFDESELFAIDRDSYYKSTLLLGCAGSGKTTVINQCIAQILNRGRNGDTVTVVFDTKQDYLNHHGFYNPSEDIVIGLEGYSRKNSWNVFEEVLADGIDKIMENALELSRILFSGMASSSQPFFVNAAEKIFSHSLVYLIREARKNPKKYKPLLNNEGLVGFLKMESFEGLAHRLSEYPDLSSSSTYISKDAPGQAQSVMSELHLMLDRIFQGSFLDSNGKGFSIRKAVREKKNPVIFIEYDFAKGKVLEPIYAALIDLVLKEALSANSNGIVNIVLDELALLPNLSNLTNCLNFGRGKQVSVIAGIQNTAQILGIYGKDIGSSILAGFGNVVMMQVDDFESAEWFSSNSGKCFETFCYYDRSYHPVYGQRERNVVETADIADLGVGEAIVRLKSQKVPFRFQFSMDRFVQE